MAFYLADTISTVAVGWDFFKDPIATVSAKMDYAEPETVSPPALRQRFNNAREQGYLLNPETLPKRVRWMTARKTTPDILPWFVVSERFRAFVEAFEPGVHQFVPVDVWRDKKGERVEHYYWFVVCRRLHSVNRELTNFHWVPTGDGKDEGYWSDRIYNPEDRSWTKVPDARLIFDTRKIGSHGVWCDPSILTFGHRLCSQRFGEAAMKEEFLGLGVSERPEA